MKGRHIFVIKCKSAQLSEVGHSEGSKKDRLRSESVRFSVWVHSPHQWHIVKKLALAEDTSGIGFLHPPLFSVDKDVVESIIVMDDVTRDYWKKVKQISLSINLSASFLLGDNAKDVQLSHHLDIVDKAAQLLVTVDKCTKDINHGQSLLVQSRDFSALIYSVFPQLIYSFPSSPTPFALPVNHSSSTVPVPISPPPPSPSSNPQYPIFPTSSNVSVPPPITSHSSESIPTSSSKRSVPSSPMASPISPRGKPPFLSAPPITPKIERVEEKTEDKENASPESVFTIVGADEEPPKKKRRPRAPAPFIDGMFCHSCGETSTSQWRRGPDGCKSLCNACGIRFANIVNKEKGIPVTNQSIPINMLLNNKQPPPSPPHVSPTGFYGDTPPWAGDSPSSEPSDPPNPQKVLPPGWTSSPPHSLSSSTGSINAYKEKDTKSRSSP